MWWQLKTFIVKSFGILHNEMVLVVSSMFTTASLNFNFVKIIFEIWHRP